MLVPLLSVSLLRWTWGEEVGDAGKLLLSLLGASECTFCCTLLALEVFPTEIRISLAFFYTRNKLFPQCYIPHILNTVMTQANFMWQTWLNWHSSHLADQVEIVNCYAAIYLPSHKSERHIKCKAVFAYILEFLDLHYDSLLQQKFVQNHRITEGGRHRGRLSIPISFLKAVSNRLCCSIWTSCVRGPIYQHISVDTEILFTNSFALRLYLYFRFSTNHCTFSLTGLPFNHVFWTETVRLSQ